MNRKQWNALGIGSMIFGIYLLLNAIITSCSPYVVDLYVACTIKNYAYAIPGLIFIFWGLMSYVIAGLEPQKKES